MSLTALFIGGATVPDIFEFIIWYIYCFVKRCLHSCGICNKSCDKRLHNITIDYNSNNGNFTIERIIVRYRVAHDWIIIVFCCQSGGQSWPFNYNSMWRVTSEGSAAAGVRRRRWSAARGARRCEGEVYNAAVTDNLTFAQLPSHTFAISICTSTRSLARNNVTFEDNLHFTTLTSLLQYITST